MNQNLTNESNPSYDFTKKKKYFAVVITADKQRFRFSIEPLLTELKEEKGEEIIEEMLRDYEYGREKYEESVNDDLEIIRQYARNFKDAEESAEWNAVFGVMLKICRKAYDAIDIEIYSQDEEKESLLINSRTLESLKRQDEKYKAMQQEEKEHAKFWEGYDKGRAEAFAEVQEQRRRQQKKGFWYWLAGFEN